MTTVPIRARKKTYRALGAKGKPEKCRLSFFQLSSGVAGDTLLRCPRAKFCRIDIDGECRMSSASIIMAQVISTKSPVVPAEDTGLVEN